MTPHRSLVTLSACLAAVALTVPTGLTHAGVAAATSSATGWSRPVAVDPPVGSPASVSCPTTTFCLAVDWGGNALTFDGTSWTGPVPVVPAADRTRSFPQGGQVSCVSSAFCLVVENAGSAPYDIAPSYAQTFDGTRWSDPVEISPDVTIDVSCATLTWCVATTEGTTGTYAHSVVFDGSSWSAPATIADSYWLTAISCPAVDFCMGVGNGRSLDHAFVFDGSTWTATAGPRINNPLEGVSCLSPDWCMAVGWYAATTYDGTTWSKPHRITFSRSTRLGTVSCASTTMCVALAYKSFLLFDGTTWTPAHRMSWRLMYPTDASCVMPTWCMSVAVQTGVRGRYDGGDGYALTLNGQAWSQPTRIEDKSGDSQGVSCPTASFCAAVDAAGAVVTRTNGTWNTPLRIDPKAELTAVSCTSRLFCIAVDNLGRTMTYNGTTWSKPVAVAQTEVPFTSVSCASSTRCIALFSDATASFYDGAQWTSPTRIEPGLLTYAVSCPAPTFCLAVGTLHGTWQAVTYDGTRWSDQAGLESYKEPVYASCASSTLCVVMDYLSNAQVFANGVWSEQQKVGSNGGWVQALSCGLVCVAVDGLGQAITYAADTWAAPETIDPHGTPRTVSCTASGSCVVLDTDGWALTRAS